MTCQSLNPIFILIMCWFIGTNAFAQDTQKTMNDLADLVPAGYMIVNEIKGDLNKDNQGDFVLIIKGTDSTKIVDDKHRGELDRNRRGIIVAYKSNAKYNAIIMNLDCFTSENEDGYGYLPPDLDVRIDNGNLYINYMRGRSGYWTYTFRYQHSDFQLIGFDRSVDRGPVVQRFVSINFMTTTLLIRENVDDGAEPGNEIFKETWKRFSLPKLINLSEVDDFDNFDVESLLNEIQ